MGGSFWWQNFWIWFMGLMTVGWICTTWIRARHGYPVEDSFGGMTPPPGHDANTPQALAERDRKIAELEERIRVLERIVTDTHKASSLREEIERLET